MKIYQTKELRNVSILGGAHSGKTTLAECIAFSGGKMSRRGSIEDKNTVSDYKEVELDRGSSVYLSPVFAELNNHKINAIDTPGMASFVGEVVTALHVTDTALVVLNAQHGVEVGAELAWRQIDKLSMPAMVIVNQLDLDKANFEETVNQAKLHFGKKVTVVQYPVNQGDGFDSVVDVIKMKLLKFTADGKHQELDIPEAEKQRAADYQNTLIEAAAENDDSLMELFFEVGTLTEDEVRKGLKAGIMTRGIIPVMCVSAKQNYGVGRLLDFIVRNIPAPDEGHVLKYKDGAEPEYDAQGKEALFVYKTMLESHLGEVSLFKVTNGKVLEGMDLVNARTGGKERLTQLFVLNGKNREKVTELVAGDIAATIKLKDTHTQDTLHSLKAETSQEIAPIAFPEPRHRAAIRVKDSADEEKMGTVLRQLHKEDQTLLIENSVELKQTILSGQGELHLNVIKWIIEKQHRIVYDYIAPKIPFRETITKSAKAMYRHKKQSGGAGQFGEVYLMIEPYHEGMENQKQYSIRGTEEQLLPWGGKLVFHNCIVGGAIDARFLPAVLKGVMEKMEEGPLTGSYARDIVVSVYDGKMHPVDSNELSFKLAGRNAFREAFKSAGPKIMEPVYDIEIFAPEEKMGDVMTDLQGRRAMIMGMEGEGMYQRVKAKVPLAEMDRYSTSLNSMTNGRATYGMKFAEYQQVPSDVQEVLLNEYEKHAVEEE